MCQIKRLAGLALMLSTSLIGTVKDWTQQLVQTPDTPLPFSHHCQFSAFP
jgi:hypothetical protein